MTTPDWARVTPTQALHTPPQEVGSAAPPLTAKRVGVIGEVLIDLILAQVCLALGNVSILGVKPFTFLTQWGYDLQQKAADAYRNSFAVVDAVAGSAAGTTTSGSIIDIYNAAAAINSTANTAGANAATAVSTANTANTTANTAQSTANTASTNASTALSTANTANTNANTANTTTGNTIDGIVRGLLGLIDSGFNPSDAEAAAKSVSDAVTALATTVASLQQDTAKFSGVAEYINFGTYAAGASMGSQWSQSYTGSGSGTWGISGGRLKWLGSASNRWAYARYLTTKTNSDYQKIGAAFASSPSRDIFGGSKSTNRIVCRLSTDFTSFVSLDLRADGFTLGSTSSGSFTTLATNPSSFTFKAGAIYWLEAGTTGGARIFRVWENNRILLTYTDSAAITPLGSGNRSVGLACNVYSDFYKPGEVAALAFFDNTPAPILGSGWRISRTSTSTTDYGTGENTFPSGWFNTVDYISDDLVYTSWSNTVTVAATGWYSIVVKQHGDGSVFGVYSVQPTVRVNGSVVMRGNNYYWNNYNSGFAGTFIVYLTEGDVVSPGYWTSYGIGGALGGGDASGFNTYWSGVFVGNNRKPTSN